MPHAAISEALHVAHSGADRENLKSKFVRAESTSGREMLSNDVLMLRQAFQKPTNITTVYSLFVNFRQKYSKSF